MSNNKYLDITGVDTLWKAVKSADSKVAESKASYITYTNGEIQLWASEEASKVENAQPLSSFSAAEFVNDGMLESVETVEATATMPIVYKGTTYLANETFIKFTFNEAAGDADGETDGIQKKVLYLKADEIGKMYTAGEGVSLAGDKIAITNVKADIATTVSDITVEGGPLASLLKNNGITTITAGTSLQSLFETLFSKEYWPADGQLGNPSTATPTYSEGSLSVSYSKPSITLSNAGKDVEAGTYVNLSTVTGTDKTHTGTARSFANFDKWGYGVMNAETGKIDVTKNANPSSISVTNVQNIAASSATPFKLTRSFNSNWGTTGLESSTSSSETSYSSCSIAAYNNLQVGDGACTVTFKMEGPGKTAEIPANPAYYHVSNLYKTDANKYLAAVSRLPITKAASAGTQTATVTGKRYVFWGAYAEPQTINSDTIRGLGGLNTGEGAINADVQNKAFGATGEKTINMTTSGVKQFIVAIPQANGKKLTSAKNETAMGNEELSFFTNNKTTVNVKGANDYTAVTYDVYVYTSGTAWSGDGKAYTINIG